MTETALVGLTFLAGVLVGVGGVAWWRRRRWRGRDDRLPVEAPHVVDLLRRAHGGVVACVVTADDDHPLVSEASPRPPRALVDQAVALATLGMGDGREHVVREEHALVAAGDGDHGCAVVLAGEASRERIAAVSQDLRQLLADFGAQRAHAGGRPGGQRLVPDWLAVAPHSVDGLAGALCRASEAACGAPAAVALRDRASRITSVVAVSQHYDRMLLGTTVTHDSAIGRAVAGDIPVVGGGAVELFGRPHNDRRRLPRHGTAFPLRDGVEGIGALVVFAEHDAIDPAVRERILYYTVDAGPRLGRAVAVQAAEIRAVTDELTGLPNRRALDQAMAAWRESACSMLCVDLDHFKQLNDCYGHIAGDAALRHVAQVFRRALRDRDIAARVGGEEFALWLPQTSLSRAVDVAERIRGAMESSAVPWTGADLRVTCSVGVAAVPDCVSLADQLLVAADAALYQAKRAGRNRVEIATLRLR
jgi:diguanylate cyclase (GGDEF)-like protein